MKTKTIKALGAAVALFLGLGGALPVLATSTGSQSLGPAATATDAFTFTCPTSAISAQANVEDLPPVKPARMRVMLAKGGAADQETDLNPLSTAGEGQASRPSPSRNAVLAKGSGRYIMIFSKTAIGSENYRGAVVCKTVTGGTFNPSLTPIRNQ